jgi:hypothetical protein
MCYGMKVKSDGRSLVVFVIAALGILLVPAAKGQESAKAKAKAVSQTWDVTVDVTKGDTDYQVLPDQTNYSFLCKFAAGDEPASKKVLRVCPGDSVYWHALTKLDNSKLKSQMIILFEDDIIPNDRKNLAHTFKAQDGAKDGGVIDTNASSDVPYEYSVFVFDKNAKQVFIDDPKIIIGTGYPIQVDTLSKQIQVIKDQVIQLANKANDDDSAKNELRKRILCELDFLEKSIALR